MKANLKNSFSKNAETEEEEIEEIEEIEDIEEEIIDVENLPPARQKSEDKKGQTTTEEDEEYEKAQLDGESIDEIFADVDDLEDDEKK